MNALLIRNNFNGYYCIGKMLHVKWRNRFTNVCKDVWMILYAASYDFSVALQHAKKKKKNYLSQW